MGARKLVMAGIVSGSVGVGMLIGAVAFTPGIGLAASRTDAAGEVASVCRNVLDVGPIAAAAEAIGIDASDLLADLRGGQTIAEVARDHGVDPSDVVDAILAEARERLDRAVADGALTREQADERMAELEEMATDLMNGDLAGSPPWPRPPAGRPGLWGVAEGPLAAVAEAIGITPGQLLSAIRDGGTIAEIAADHGVAVDDVVDAVVAALQDRLDAAVRNGWIAREEADERSAGLREQAARLVNGDPMPVPFPVPWGPGRGRFGVGVDRDAAEWSWS